MPTKPTTKALLNCFEYIKRYHTDMFLSLGIMLEIVWLKRHGLELLASLIARASKRKPIYEECTYYLKTHLGEKLYVPPNPHSNLLKILKSIMSSDTSNRALEEFLHIITQKKTTHKLFAYSTPLEVNELLVGLLEIKNGETVYNPCYGMGSLFFALSGLSITLYGEELESALARIAQLICKILDIKDTHLVLNNILTKEAFSSQKFDKIICNPPLDSHIGTQLLKEDARFATYETLIKTYPELLFLIHSLAHLKHKGVFILRTQSLQKSSLEGRLRERLCEERLIESIIELPKNIFPHQTNEFSLIVLSGHNDSILHINANAPYFYRKDGKYNRLIHIEKLLDIYHKRQTGTYSILTPIDKIDIADLRVQAYIHKPNLQNNNTISLKQLGFSIFRGQRVYGGSDEEDIEYFDLGIADFADCGFCEHFSIKRLRGEINKIRKYRLKPYDIALSIRANTPKFTILSPKSENQLIIANTGIIILRASQKDIALNAYCYFFSTQGQKALSSIYERNLGSITPTDLEELHIVCYENVNAIFAQIQSYATSLQHIHSQIRHFKEQL